MKVFMVVLLVERFIFPMQYSNMSNSHLWGADVYPWISNSSLPKQGMTDLEEYRCLLYSAAPISQDGPKQLKIRCFVCCFLFFIQGRCWRCCLHFNNMSALSVILYPVHFNLFLFQYFAPLNQSMALYKNVNGLGRMPN